MEGGSRPTWLTHARTGERWKDETFDGEAGGGDGRRLPLAHLRLVLGEVAAPLPLRHPREARQGHGRRGRPESLPGVLSPGGIPAGGAAASETHQAARAPRVSREARSLPRSAS